MHDFARFDMSAGFHEFEPVPRDVIPEVVGKFLECGDLEKGFARYGEAKMTNHVYKHLELTGSSPTGIEDAVSNAIAKAAVTVRNIMTP